MAYGIVHHFPGGTKAQYEASLAAVRPGYGSLPYGQLFHAAGLSAEAGRSSRSMTPRAVGSVSATTS
jgi:hypothetical protein